MKLTPRQYTFLSKLVEICTREDEFVHYSLIATELEVNKFSAYDMLHLLERKGLARSEYVLSGSNPGPGRSQVVFAPTPQGLSQVQQPAADTATNRQDWLSSRQHMLDLLNQAKKRNSWEGLRDILARLPGARTRLTYCGQMITALLVNLNIASLQDSVLQVNLLKSVDSLMAPEEVGLSTLGGFSLGASLSQRIDSPLLEDLVAHTKRYQSYLLTLSEESKATLIEFLREALAILDQQQAV